MRVCVCVCVCVRECVGVSTARRTFHLSFLHMSVCVCEPVYVFLPKLTLRVCVCAATSTRLTLSRSLCLFIQSFFVPARARCSQG